MRTTTTRTTPFISNWNIQFDIVFGTAPPNRTALVDSGITQDKHIVSGPKPPTENTTAYNIYHASRVPSENNITVQGDTQAWSPDEVKVSAPHRDTEPSMPSIIQEEPHLFTEDELVSGQKQSTQPELVSEVIRSTHSNSAIRDLSSSVRVWAPIAAVAAVIIVSLLVYIGIRYCNRKAQSNDRLTEEHPQDYEIPYAESQYVIPYGESAQNSNTAEILRSAEVYEEYDSATEYEIYEEQ